MAVTQQWLDKRQDISLRPDFKALIKLGGSKTGITKKLGAIGRHMQAGHNISYENQLLWYQEKGLMNYYKITKDMASILKQTKKKDKCLLCLRRAGGKTKDVR